MQLDLTRYRQPVSEFARTFTPEDVEGKGDAYRIVAPVEVDERCASAPSATW